MKYKPETAVTLARRILEPGDAVLEIGAADGEYTRIYAERVGSTGHVIAVEPHVTSRRALRRAVAHMPWVTVKRAAVGERAGTIVFYPDRKEPKRSSLYGNNVHHDDHAGASYLVPVTTVDALVSQRQTPALIHVDAQGAEAAILRGAQRTLWLPIVWVIEIWPVGLRRAAATFDDVLLPFASRGYRPETVHGDPWSWEKAHKACQREGREKQGHLDLVMVPHDLCIEAVA